MSQGDKPTILHLIDSFDQGGAQENLLLLLKNRDREQFHYAVAALNATGHYLEEFRTLGIEVYSLASSRYDPRMLLRLRSLLRSIRPDILHTHLVISNCIGKLCSVDLPNTHLVTHVVSENPFSYEYSLLKSLDAWANRKSSAIIAVSFGVDRFLVGHDKLDRHKVYTIPAAADLDHLESLPSSTSNELRKTLGIPSNARVLGTLCRLREMKGLLHLVEAAAQLRDRFDDLYTVIVGTGPLRESLETFVEDHDLHNRVKFTGHVPRKSNHGSNVFSWLQSFDALVLPSYAEGFPVSIVEAMALNTLVLCAKVGGLEHHYKANEEILLFEPRSTPALVSTIEKYMQLSSDERKQITSAANAKIYREFQPNQLMNELESVYRNILGTKR
jgi:glycosyltransferase involved in cell wall biosynthesis